MKLIILFLSILSSFITLNAQSFTRTELSTEVNAPLTQIRITDLGAGTYVAKMNTASGQQITKLFTKI